MKRRLELSTAGVARDAYRVGRYTLAAAFLVGCRGRQPENAEAASVPPATVTIGPENIAVAKTTRIEQGPALSGSLAPETQAEIRAELSGSVLQTYAEQGQPVRNGQVLARIDDVAVRDQVLSARSGVASAEAAAANAQREQQRSARLLGAGAVAERDVENARQANVAAQAQLSNARAQLANAEQQLSRTTVRAPFTGVVSERAVSAGSVVSPGTALFTVVKPGSMRLEAGPERRARRPRRPRPRPASAPASQS
jgi:RND family efflux transporter MFP subunit